MGKNKKFYSLMLFFSEKELGISDDPTKFVLVNKIHFNDGFIALEAYANTRCPASQLVSAETNKGLLKKENEMVNNFKNPEWVKELMETL